MSSAFVTGGSGFIGSRLIKRLRAEGWEIHALARSDSSAAKVRELGAEPAPGDLSDSNAIEAGARGCDVAFHLAAHLGQWGKREEFERDNVEGTANTLAGCRAAGVRRFVHCGTEAALIAGEPLVNVDETAPLRPDSKALYSSTKAKAEQLVRDATTGRGARSASSPGSVGFETVVLRPRFVWGEGDTTLLPNIVGMVEAGRFAWIGGGGHLTATTHVDNVVEGLILAADRGKPGEAYFVTDGDPVVFREFLSEMIETQGVEPPTRSMPAALAGAVAPLMEGIWRTLRLGGEPPATRLAVWLSSQECTIDISKARRELGYEPVISREQGLAEMRPAAVA